MKAIKIILFGFLAILGIIFILIHTLESPLKREFKEKRLHILKGLENTESKKIIGDKEYEKLPDTIKLYMKKTGFAGRKPISAMDMKISQAKFKMEYGSGKEMLLDYSLISSANHPIRYVFMEGSMFFIPFNGLDTLEKNRSSMQGELANSIDLFNQEGETMLKGSLITYLSEALFMPNILLDDNISLKELDKYKIEAAITYGKDTLTGKFVFDEEGQMLYFESDQRPMADFEGKVSQHKWKAECLDYKKNKDGLTLPTRLKASWYMDDAWWTYFDGQIDSNKYY